MRLLGQRRFLPLFITQFLGAFNDSIFKMAVVVLATYTIYNDPKVEAFFSQMVGALFILPFFLLSAISGQLADSHDKSAMARVIKTAEIVIMFAGGLGIWLHNIPLMLVGVFAMGVHSTFFGPIKYAILPQHLDADHVLGGTGLVEAGTYVSILVGTVIGGWIHPHWAIAAVLGVAILGRISSQFMPPAPAAPESRPEKLDWNIVRASWVLVRHTLHTPRVFLAIMAISFFWAIGAIFAAQFPPMVKNALGADQTVATGFTALFSVGVALGSIAVNRMLNGRVSARYSPGSVIVMGLFVLDLWWGVSHWANKGPVLLNWSEFLAFFAGKRIVFDLLGISVAGGMFVVPLYAFLTITVAKTETARTIAANNIVNSAFMVVAAVSLGGLTAMGVSIEDTLFTVALSCLVSAWIAWKLHKACD